MSGADVPLNAQLSGGVILPHPTGVVIHPKAVIGPNCVIFQQVTIGRRDWERVAPVIGAGVEIGAGAKVLGPITIGDGARIGLAEACHPERSEGSRSRFTPRFLASLGMTIVADAKCCPAGERVRERG